MEKRNSTLAIWHWHIEISSKCTLKCSRCARSEVPASLVSTELSLEFFKKNFPPEFIQTEVEKITFCGNDGDPIYAHDLIDVIAYFKSVKPVEFVIVTNGSYKDESWWRRLSKVLTDIDEVHFSLDGWDQQSNEQYRTNSNWESILLGITTLRQNSTVFINWAAIAFAFNEDHLDNMLSTAKLLGCDSFQLTKSTKFNSVYPSYPINDPLQPKTELVGSAGRFEREVTQLSNRVRVVDSIATNVGLFHAVSQQHKLQSVTPLCKIGNKGLYVSALGRLYPCCWVANRYEHNSEWSRLSIDLNIVPLQQALLDPVWENELKTFRWNECRTKCNSTVANLSYCTEW